MFQYGYPVQNLKEGNDGTLGDKMYDHTVLAKGCNTLAYFAKS
jgi:hypothetical protein